MSLFERIATWMALFVIAIGALFSFSETVHAGLLSFVSNILGGEQASAQTEISAPPSNSQTLAILQAAANTDPNPHKSLEIAPMVGNTLVADLASADSPATEPVNTQISTYVVREGDTLSDIATMFNVSINTIMWANDISKAKSIRPGETLIILPVSGISYTVKKGDTVQGIAGKYKADVTDILNYNGLADSDILLAGQTIIIPDAEIQTAVPTRIIAGTGSSGPSYSGYYIRPIKGGVRSQGIHGYNGVDLAAPLGTPVYASAEGTVILSKSGGYNGGYGNYIIVSHPNGTQTLYAHLSRNLVSAGTRVEQGEEIAKMGSTGKSTGSHVHFEIRGAKNPF